MSEHYEHNPQRFASSRRLVWATLIMVNLIMLLLAFLAKDVGDLAGVFTAGITTQLGLAAAWSGITNMSEVKRP